jgi:hypothetical protein
MVVVSFASVLMLVGCWLRPGELKVIMHKCEAQLNRPLDKNLEAIQSFAEGDRAYLVLVHLRLISWAVRNVVDTAISLLCERCLTSHLCFSSECQRWR